MDIPLYITISEHNVKWHIVEIAMDIIKIFT